ncbi:FadR family transcriptional regulator [Microlunatus elymi]|uniref:FadR family transcriptional regulator n=1 Tax=Microlunatus elymi TaxID=2596828 RepID=A0A516PVQ0_9ACTN|nr:FadR/GntR family transcriptional regulator [Microlunatus elymi]QDP95265.1 FadR family transcriptional regulator [Microlunatus elymi]
MTDETPTTSSNGRYAVDLVVGRIKTHIRANDLQPGDRLPPERALAAEMTVSRNTIREALSSLEHMGVIEIKRGSGAFVRKLEPHVLLDGVSFMIEVSPMATLLDFLTLRRIVEAEAASLATVRMTEAELVGLRECLEGMPETPFDAELDTSPETVEQDIRFHRLICEAARNPALSTLDTALNSSTFRLRVRGGVYRSSARPADARSEHAPIFDAIRDRDPARASAAAAAHVGAVERRLREALEGPESQD